MKQQRQPVCANKWITQFENVIIDTPHVGAIPGQQRHSGSSRDLYWHWGQPFEACVTEISIFLSYWMAVSLLCDVRYVTTNEFSWELVYCCVTHVTEQWSTPVGTLPTRFIHIIPSCWIIHRSFGIILEWELSTGMEWNSNLMFYANRLLQKAFNLIWSIFENMLTANGSSGSDEWSWAKRERTKSRECILRTIFFDTGHLQHEHEMPDMEIINKIQHMNGDKAKWKEPE